MEALACGYMGASNMLVNRSYVGWFPCEHIVALTLSFPRIAADHIRSVARPPPGIVLQPALAPGGGTAHGSGDEAVEEDADSSKKLGVYYRNFGLR